MPRRVICRGELRGGVDISETVLLDYGSFQAEIFISVEDPRGEEFVIEGTEGKIRIPYFHMAQEAYLYGQKEERFLDKAPKYGVQFRRVSEEIAKGCRESAFCSPGATIDTMRLLDECRKQLGLIYPSERTESRSGER